MSILQNASRPSLRLKSKTASFSVTQPVSQQPKLASQTKVRDMLRDIAFVLHTTRKVADSIRAQKTEGSIA